MKTIILLLVLAVQVTLGQQSPHGDIKIACEVCHSTDSWTLRNDASFNHNSTGFPLVGRHKSVSCKFCHENLVFTKQSSDCASCHTDVHRQELGTNCVRCHSMESWIVSDMKQKHQETRFPLMGKHAIATCDECHIRATTHQYAGTPLTCITCHKNVFEATTAPNHTAAAFGIDCSQCHKMESMSWSSGFDHNMTAFPLTGGHRAIICSDCHVNNQFKKLSTQCYDCHSSAFANTQSPNHMSGNFSHDCLSCHTTTAWQPASFDHNATKLPLTGKHTTTACEMCHTNGNYQLAYVDCYQCHQSDFQRPTDPNHVSANFSHNCLTCHSTTTWSGSSFDHGTTKFSLTGKHLTTLCQSCHTNGNYQLAYANCYQCHQTDFQQSTNPNHVTGNFDHNCMQCHSTTSWTSTTFNHSATKFSLTGKHLSALCQSCHTNGNYQLSYTDCYQCHQSDFQVPTNPNHVTANFGHDCQPCHSTSVWKPSTFNHDQQYFKIYSGTHQGRWTLCADCHQSNADYSQFSCINCHEHNKANTDSHHTQVANYVYLSSACYDCHKNK